MRAYRHHDITDAAAAALPPWRRLAQRWVDTAPVRYVPPPMRVLIDWHDTTPTLLQRLARAWRAFWAD